MDLQKEEQQLAKAERDLQSTREQIARQRLLIERLRRDGHNTARSEQLLLTFEACQASQESHVALLQREIKRQPQDDKLSEKARIAIADSHRQLSVD